MNKGISRRNVVKGAAALAATSAAAAEPASNRVCEVLGIEKPVIQALMNGLTSTELAAAVAEAGGLGILQLPDAETIAAYQAICDKPLCAAYYSYDDETAVMLKECGVDIVLYANGGPASDNDFTVWTEPISQFKAAGFKVIYKGLNATRENVLAAQEAGADVIVVLGFGAGGCGPKVVANTAELVAEFSDVLDIPVIAGGGIVNGKSAMFAAAAGAEGAYVGTGFLACDESPCSDVTKQAIVDLRAEQLVPVPWQSGSDGWMLMSPSALREEGLAMAAQGATPSDIFMTTNVVYGGMFTGEIEDSGICVGVGCSMICEVRSAAAIVEDIAAPFMA